jgi:hypothetical protein
MLARRKPNPQDDEPLVPRGLISQALDASPSTSENAPSTQLSSSPPTTAEALKLAPARALRWPRAARQVKEGMRIVRAVPPTLQHVRKHVQTSTDQISSQWAQASNFASACAGAIRSNVIRVVPAALHKIRSSAQLSSNIARFRKFTSASASRAVGLSRDWSTQAVVNFRRLTRASSQRLKQMHTQARLQEPKPAVGFRLRVQLAGAPLKARIAWARASSEWDLRWESLSKNSRLWSSLALSALSALAIMGIFSTARHYAKASLPSNRAASVSSTKNADTATAVVPLTVKVPRRVSAIQTSQPESTSARPRAAQHKIQHPAVPARQRVHRNEDEDYVAKDTYVNYGKRSSGQTKTAKD